MLPQRLILAWVFRLSGLSIGLPALCVFLDLGVAYITTARTPASQPIDVTNYGLIGLLVSGVRGFSAVFGTLLDLVRDAFGVLAVMALALSLVGVLLFWVGSGIDKGATWARVSALIISAALLFLWLSLVAVSTGPFRGVAGGGVAVSVWALWVLIWYFR